MPEGRTPIKLRIPDRISATRVGTASGCPLRFVLETSIDEGELALPSSSGARYLGIAFHHVIEVARRGEAGDPPERARLEQHWRRGMSLAEEQAVKNGDDIWIPLRETQPFVERTRLSAIRLASIQCVAKGTGKASGGTNHTTETWLKSTDGRVVGRLDAIDRHRQSVVIRDYKSGAAVDASGAIKREYVTQMLLYAALYFDNYGVWPRSLEVIDQRGRTVPIATYTPESALAALETAKTTLQRVQSELGHKPILAAPRVVKLAEPDSGQCGSCRSRPVCSRYLDTLDTESLRVHGDSGFASVDVAGTVEHLDTTADGLLHLELSNDGEARSVQNVTAPEEPLLPGDRLAVFNALPRRPLVSDPLAHQLLATRSSRAFRLHDQGS